MRAKKSYGQHFLKSDALAERIANSLQMAVPCQQILEVGPGKGRLTEHLLALDTDLVVVEADRDMVFYLKQNYPQLKGQIIEADFLKVDLSLFFKKEPFALIGNFPYNISSQILFKMLEYKEQIPEMVGMFQKEVAERIVAPPGNKTYGVVSVLVQAYYEGELLFEVDKSEFSPPPKVQSAVIRLERKPSLDLGCSYKLFRQVVKLAFSQRRKMLRNTMKTLVKNENMLKETFFKQRPERLSVQDYVQLTNRIEDEIKNEERGKSKEER